MSERKSQVSLDEGRKGTAAREASVIPKRLLSRADEVDATGSLPSSKVRYEVRAITEEEKLGSTLQETEVRMPLDKDADRYNMGHSKRGTCLVFNQEEFEKKKYNRKGSGSDVKRIEATFKRLGFDVVVHCNLAYIDVIGNIQSLSKNIPTNNDCVCVFVLTHGDDDDLLAAGDLVWYPSDKIWKPFTADICPTLAGKPKLFFLQACRGDKSDTGVPANTQPENHERERMNQDTTASYRIPTHSDFLIAHSTTGGLASWRNCKKGTWFVQSLCDVLDSLDETALKSTELRKILTVTARKVATDFELYYDTDPLVQKQIPSTTSTLTRNLYFTPK